MKYSLFLPLLAASGLTLFTPSLPIRADDSPGSSENYSSADTSRSDADFDSAFSSDDTRSLYSFDGTILKVSPTQDRLTVVSETDHYYRVDTYNCDIVVGRNHDGSSTDLEPGMHVHIAGTRRGRNLIEADQMRVTPQDTPVVLDNPPVRSPDPVSPPPAIIAASLPTTAFITDGIVTKVDSDSGHAVLLTDDDHRYTLDTTDADIILRNSDHAGTTNDLAHGMRVHVIGTQLVDGDIEADRIRILPAIETLAPLPVAPPPVESLDSYTGIIIDTRGLNIMRSPAPSIYGPDPDDVLLYPDRSHVPTPDEVQDESIVRYYRTEDAARDGVGGSNPLIIPAMAVVGPAHDGVALSADNAALFQALDKRLHFTRNWKVGFLIPEDQ
jgi:hypothetical protein